MKMWAAVCVFILMIYTLSGSSGLVSRPSRVRLTSFNMDLVLRWDLPTGAEGDLRYTAQYRGLSSYRQEEWKTHCVNVSLLECDLSQMISAFGIYEGRVRSHRGEEISEWVESNNFTMDRDTIIGPPAISLISRGQQIEVSVSDPEFNKSALRSVYSSPTYNITYWRDGHKHQAKSLTKLQQNSVVLDELDPWTKYCVQGQIHTEVNLNPSQPSRIVCKSTTNGEEAPWVAAVVIFVFMVIVMALVVVSVVYRKRISHCLCPKVSLPQHFMQMLAPPNSHIYQAMQDSKTPEEVCHPVSVIFKEEEECSLQADGTKVEEQRPLQADRTEEEEDGQLQRDRTEEEEDGQLQRDRTEEEEERPLQADRTKEVEERPLQADRTEEEEDGQLQADRTEEEEDGQLQRDRTKEEEDGQLQRDRTEEEEDGQLQRDRTEEEEERPLQADRTKVEEQRPLQADITKEERPLQAVVNSCSTESDVTEGGGAESSGISVTQVQPNQPLTSA